MRKSNLKNRKPVTEEIKERFLGGNVFGLDFLFDGDYAAKDFTARKKWTVPEVREWQNNIGPSNKFIAAYGCAGGGIR